MDRPLHQGIKMKTNLFSLFLFVFLLPDALAQKNWVNWDTFQIELKSELYSRNKLTTSISVYNDYLSRVVKNPINEQKKKLQNLSVLLEHYNWMLDDTIKYIEPTTSLDWKNEPMKEALPNFSDNLEVNVLPIDTAKLKSFRKRKSTSDLSQLERTMIFLANSENSARQKLQNDMYTRLKKVDEQQLKWRIELEKRIIEFDSNLMKANLALLERHDYERKNSHNNELNSLRIQILLAVNDARY